MHRFTIARDHSRSSPPPHSDPQHAELTPQIRGVFIEASLSPIVRYPWSLLSPPLHRLLDSALDAFTADIQEAEDAAGPPRLEYPGGTLADARSYLHTQLSSFTNAAPFTLQRLCEVVLQPLKQYNRAHKFILAIERILNVTGTIPLSSDLPPRPLLSSLDAANVNENRPSPYDGQPPAGAPPPPSALDDRHGTLRSILGVVDAMEGGSNGSLDNETYSIFVGSSHPPATTLHAGPEPSSPPLLVLGGSSGGGSSANANGNGNDNGVSAPSPPNDAPLVRGDGTDTHNTKTTNSPTADASMQGLKRELRLHRQDGSLPSSPTSNAAVRERPPPPPMGPAEVKQAEAFVAAALADAEEVHSPPNGVNTEAEVQASGGAGEEEEERERQEGSAAGDDDQYREVKKTVATRSNAKEEEEDGEGHRKRRAIDREAPSSAFEIQKTNQSNLYPGERNQPLTQPLSQPDSQPEEVGGSGGGGSGATAMDVDEERK